MKRFIAIFLCAAFCPAHVVGQTPEQKQQTIAALQKLQARDGGFLPAFASNEQTPSSLRALTSALRALKYFGGEPTVKDPCGHYVERCFDRDGGGFADHPGAKPDVATTAIGIMAAVELKMPLDDYRASAVKYLSGQVKTFEDIRIAAAAFEAIKERPPQADA